MKRIRPRPGTSVHVVDAPPVMTFEGRLKFARRMYEISATARIPYNPRDIPMADLVEQLRYMNRWDFHQWDRKRGIVHGYAGRISHHCGEDS